jgi:replicative DNA helicase
VTPSRDSQDGRLDWRTLRVGAELEARPSAADEEQLTREARDRDEARLREHLERQQAVSEMLRHLKAAEREIAAAVGHLVALRALDRPTRRDLARARQAIGRIRERRDP